MKENKLISDALRALLQNTKDFVFVKDKDLIYVGSSRAFAVDCLDCNGPEDVVGHTDFELFKNQLLAKKYREDDEQLKDGRISELECRETYPSRNGEIRYCMTTKYTIRDKDGNFAGIFGQFRDITEQVELEEKELFQQEEIEKARENDRKNHELLKMRKLAGDLIARSKIINTILIEKETGEMQVFDSVIPDRKGKTFNFREAVEKEVMQIDEKSREAYLRDMSLPQIIQEVKEHQSFMVTTNVRTKNNEHHLICYHFADYEDDPRYLLEAMEDITEQKAYDTLTDNLNMQGFEMRVDSCMQNNTEGKEYAILNFNIVNFKAVNSEYGYDVGDELLLEVSDLLKKSEMKFEAVCREASDNFFCLVQADHMTDQALGRLCKMDFLKKNVHATLQLQCGIYIINDKELEISSMCDRARMAREKIEESVNLKWYVFDDDMKQNYLDKAYVLSVLDHAIRERQFEVYYQPIYRADTKEIASAEALIRWNHPEKGFMMPGAFLPIIEKSGRMEELDLYVEEVVCGFLKERQITEKPMVPVAVNLSRYDFLQQETMDRILEILNRHPELCPYLRFEITESGYINISKSGKYFLEELRSRGCKILIDDFGSGLSSFGMVMERDCDVIKLDMSIVRRIGVVKAAKAVIEASINTAHALNVEIVAEGVETEEQFEFLRSSHCDYIQGFYLSKPLPKEEYEALLGDKLSE